MGWSLCSTLRLHSEGHSDETTDLDYVLYSGWDR